MPGNERSLWSLTTTPPQDIHALIVRGITTIGELCEVPENELAKMVSPEGLAGIKRDLAYIDQALSQS
jgi:hypothetical protein